MCVYLRICIYIFTHVYLYVNIFTHTKVQVYIFINIYIYVNIHTIYYTYIMAQCLVVPPTTRDGDGPYMCMHVNSVCIYIHPSWGGGARP